MTHPSWPGDEIDGPIRSYVPRNPMFVDDPVALAADRERRLLGTIIGIRANLIEVSNGVFYVPRELVMIGYGSRPDRCPACAGTGEWSEEFIHSGADVGIHGGECVVCGGTGEAES
jgi:hypothetical protein